MGINFKISYCKSYKNTILFCLIYTNLQKKLNKEETNKSKLKQVFIFGQINTGKNE